MTDQEFADMYRQVADVELHGETHLNSACLDAILALVRNEVVLEAGCGRGYLAAKLAGSNEVTAVDIVVPAEVRDAHPAVTFSEAGLERLPFEDNSFDTVVCTHTLEHVVDIRVAVNELRRVAKQRVVIVVPKQRPYSYGFNLHLHFFPYRWSFPSLLGYHEDHRIEDLGDWLYIETH
jgi:ubiquinone/menaquinone biosynthesis C-methylase UbiE